MAGQTTSSKALIYLSERVEDATEAVKGLIGGSGSSKYLDTSDDKVSVIRSQLDSDRDDLRLEGLQTIVALISKGRDASIYFPHVLKLTSNSNLEIRKLVYTIVRRYAKRQPDVALLGINSFQRDLLDRSEVVRAMALRVLSGLQLGMVASIVELAISKCVKDPHFYVRRGAALAIIKCHRLSSDTRQALKGHLSTLLNDRHPAVLSTALVAYSANNPRSFDMIHPHYRKLCHALSDMDEWGQRNAIEVLGLYARRCLPKPADGEKMDIDLELLLSRVEDLLMSRNPAVVTAAIRLLYNTAPASRHMVIARPLLRLVNSTSPISYFALVSCYLLSQTSPSLLSPHIGSLLLRSSLQEPNYVSCLKLRILVQLSDSSSSEMVLSELSEQARFNNDEVVAQTAVEQLGSLASKDKGNIQACTKELLKLLKECNERDEVVGTAASVLRKLINGCSKQDTAIIVSRLATLLFTPPSKKASSKRQKLVGKASIKSGLARGCIYWLVGQHCRLEITVSGKATAMASAGKEGDQLQQLSLAHAVGADILRKAAMNFSKETSFAKLQIITLSTKLYCFLPTTAFEPVKTFKSLHGYILQLARYDEDFDVRDRSRFCKALAERVEVGSLGEVSNQNGEDVIVSQDDEAKQLDGVALRRDQVLHILFEGRETNVGDFAEQNKTRKDNHSLDSLSFVLGGGKTLEDRDKGYLHVDWAAKEDLPSPSVREPVMPSQRISAVPGGLHRLESQRSFSSEGFEKVMDSSGSANTSRGEQFVATPTPGPSVPSITKYKDLDAFLDEESEKEEEESSDDESQVEEGAEEEADEDDDEDDESEEDEEQEEDAADSSEDDSEKSNSVGGKGKEKGSIIIPPLEENEWAR